MSAEERGHGSAPEVSCWSCIVRMDSDSFYKGVVNPPDVREAQGFVPRKSSVIAP